MSFTPPSRYRVRGRGNKYGFSMMDSIQGFAILLVAATAFWVYIKLKERLDRIEHEVRWLRQELEELKPTEIRSQYDS